MFVFGDYYVRFKKFPLPGYKCPYCGSEGTVHLMVGCIVNHWFLIPFNAENRRVSQRCTACKEEGIPESEHITTAERLLDGVRRPWYLYLWLWIFAVAIFIGGVAYGLRSAERRSMITEGAKMIEMVEKYRIETGSYPDSVADMGLEENEGCGPYYGKITDEVYKVVFSIGFDEQFRYYSDEQEWRYYP